MAGTGSVLSVVPRAERPEVRATARRLYLELGLAGDRALRRRVAHQIAAITPELPVDRQALLARYAIWSLRFDDALDRPAAGAGGLTRLMDAVTAVTLGGDDGGSDPLLATLAGIVGELAGYDRSGRTLGRFVTALQDWIAAEAEQSGLASAVAAGLRPPPTAEQYLLLATRTVNYLGFAYALLAVSGPPLSAGQLACVDSALWHAAWAVRLGNDLRSVDRDQAERALNVLRLRTEAGAPVTPASVEEDIRSRVQAHDNELRALSGLGAIAAWTAQTLARCLHQTLRLYSRTDLRAE
jgi:hypothetical protein